MSCMFIIQPTRLPHVVPISLWPSSIYAHKIFHCWYQVRWMCRLLPSMMLYRYQPFASFELEKLEETRREAFEMIEIQ